MAYEKTNWQDRVVEKPRTFTVTNNPDGTITLAPAPGTVLQEGTPVNAGNLNKIEGGIFGNQAKLLGLAFDSVITLPGYHKTTEFDTPTAGDITESLRLSADNSLFATRVTKFDAPAAGNITVTIQCAALGINNKVVTEFDTPGAGDIKETALEVV